MKKSKLVCLLLALVLVLALIGCGKEMRTVTCDHCGKGVEVEADSNITDEWILYCRDCEVELFGEDGLVPAE